MTDTVTIAEVNAVFDALWKDRNEVVNTLPWLYKEQVEKAATRERFLAAAYRYVAAVDAARATASAKLAATKGKAEPLPPLVLPDAKP